MHSQKIFHIFRNQFCYEVSNLKEMFKISFILGTRTRENDPIIFYLSHSRTSCICLLIILAEQSAHFASTLAMIDMARMALDNS